MPHFGDASDETAPLRAAKHVAEAARWNIEPRYFSAPIVEKYAGVGPPPIQLLERLEEACDRSPAVHRLGGVAEVRDYASQRVVAGCLSAQSGEDFTLCDGGQVEGMARDAQGHHDGVGDPFVTSRAEGGEEGLVEVDDDPGRRRLDVRASGAHAGDKGTGGFSLFGHTFREIGHPGKTGSGVGHAGVRGGRQVELVRTWCRVDVDVAAHEFDLVAHAQRPPAEKGLADLVPERLAEGPAGDFARVDFLPGHVVEELGLREAGLELVRGGGGSVAVVHEGDAVGPGDMSVLSVGPDTHEEFDVIKTPRAPLEVAICTLERL